MSPRESLYQRIEARSDARLDAEEKFSERINSMQEELDIIEQKMLHWEKRYHQLLGERKGTKCATS